MSSQPARPALASSDPPAAATSGPAPRKRKNHRGGKKKKPRKKSFAALSEDVSVEGGSDTQRNAARESFYGIAEGAESDGSLGGRDLRDHRETPSFFRARRSSTSVPTSTSYKPQFPMGQSTSRLRTVYGGDSADEDEERDLVHESSPLLAGSNRPRLSDSATGVSGYGLNETRSGHLRSRRNSSRASSSKRLGNAFSSFPGSNSYNVNYPPSMPGSPSMRPLDRDMRFDDAVLRDDNSLEATSLPGSPTSRDADLDPQLTTAPLERRHTFAAGAEEDVCFPHEGMSELADDDRTRGTQSRTRRRRRRWPDLAVLDDWNRFEKEGRTDERRSKKITEPQLINGRLRNVHKGWFRTEEDAPYRFTYFNEEFPSTIHSQTISELLQPGTTFRELFVPDRPVLESSSESESDDENEELLPMEVGMHRMVSQNGIVGSESKPGTRQGSVIAQALEKSTNPEEATLSPPRTIGGSRTSQQPSTDGTPARAQSPLDVKLPENSKAEKPVRYGDRPVWWLDILSPTEAEMRVLSKAFGIHPLTAEDIMLQEAREKVELFRHYYFVNYRTFDQDRNSENYLEPVDMYVVVFREGVLSFHFSMTPHAANVRRRVRQLRDYLILSSDWISYAIIDDITDVFVPLIQNIEDEVDDIDDAILHLHSNDNDRSSQEKAAMKSDKCSDTGLDHPAGSDMLRRVGDCRKKVMGLYRLLGNKADVIKGFAKRCNEQWEVAPRSEIGLYLGDIQDHIVTMTSNLGHYEKILARSHGNYLAQINIRMNERQEQTADVLGKLTVLGTIVLPMNIITGLWGMNVWVPGQEYEGDLKWFVVITAGLVFFGVACYVTARKVYKIV